MGAVIVVMAVHQHDSRTRRTQYVLIRGSPEPA